MVEGSDDCTSVVVDGLPDGPLLMNALAQVAKTLSALAVAMAAATVDWRLVRGLGSGFGLMLVGLIFECGERLQRDVEGLV